MKQTDRQTERIERAIERETKALAPGIKRQNELYALEIAALDRIEKKLDAIVKRAQSKRRPARKPSPSKRSAR